MDGKKRSPDPPTL